MDEKVDENAGSDAAEDAAAAEDDPERSGDEGDDQTAEGERDPGGELSLEGGELGFW